MKFIIATTILAASLGSSLAVEPNPPTWPASVHIFTPATDQADIESAVKSAYESNGGDPAVFCNNGQFSDERFAFMFTPGSYSADVPVGYYTVSSKHQNTTKTQ